MVPVFTLVWQCLLMSVVSGALSSGICSPCTCDDSPPQLTVKCSSLGLVHPPSGLPANLTKLILFNNSIYNIDKKYFEHYLNITELDLSYNVNIGLDNVSESFFGLRNSNISIINIAGIVKEYSYKRCVILKSGFFKYLTKTPLKSINMDKTWIHLIEQNSFLIAPRFLEYLSMSHSRIIVSFQFLIEMYHLKNLRNFSLSNRNTEELISNINDKTSEMVIQKDRMRKQRGVSRKSFEYLNIPLPPKLEEINFDSSAFVAVIPEIIFSKNKLKTFILKKNIIHSIIGPVHGLEKVETFDLSDNNCDTFPANASSVIPMPKLRYLYLKGNNFDFSKKENFFEHYQNLRVLDVSYNKVSILPETLFDNLLLLEELNMKGNIIYIFNVDLRNLHNLRILDISENKISVLSETMTNQLDAIREVTNLTLDLTENPIRCSCEAPNLQFIRWIVHTNVNIQQKSTLTCLINGEIKKVIKQLYIKELDRKCESPTRHYSLAMGASVTITGCMSFIIMGLIYRYRYKLAYIYFIGRRRYRHQAANDEDYNMLMEFDAYVAYADEDRQFGVHTFREKLELGHQLKFCFRDRDFLPGEVIASCIVSAIQRSRRVIMVLSPEFLKSGWRIYDFEMAHCESIERARDMIVLVKYKDFPLKDVPEEMLRMLHSQTYLEFPDTEEDQETFWETMKERISEM